MPKGRNSFSRSEADQIRDLLDQKIKSGNLRRFRDELRRIGFFSDDFKRVSNGFAPEDFDELIRNKRIKVHDNEKSI